MLKHEEILDFMYSDIMKEKDQYYCGLFNDLSRDFVLNYISGFWSNSTGAAIVIAKIREAYPGDQGLKDLQKDLMCYTVCHMITDSSDWDNLLFNLQSLSFYRPTEKQLSPLLLELPIQYIMALNKLPSKEEYMNIGIERLKGKTNMHLGHFIHDVLCFRSSL